MGRAPRVTLGNHVYHVLNRANARISVFNTKEDYILFIKLLSETATRVEMRILSYCIMPNHWHLLLYPKKDGDLSIFMKLLTAAHTQKHHGLRRTIGTGHIYQGRYKSFLVATNEYTLQVCRYIERNPLRAKLVTKAEQWEWSSLHERISADGESKMLSEMPVDLPKDYLSWVNEIEPSEDTDQIRSLIKNKTKRGRPQKGA